MLIVVVNDWIWMHLLASLLASLLVCFAFACTHSLKIWRATTCLSRAAPNISHPRDELRKIILLPRRNQDPCQKRTSRASPGTLLLASWFGGCGAAQPHEFSQVWGVDQDQDREGKVWACSRGRSSAEPGHACYFFSSTC